MKITTIGSLLGPTAMIVGSWEPLVPLHLKLFKSFLKCVKSRGLTSTATILDPSPSTILYGRPHYTRLHDIKFRVALLKYLGFDNQVIISLSKYECGKGAAYFLSSIRHKIDIAELYLGKRQGLGPDPQGGPIAIENYCKNVSIQTFRLPNVNSRVAQGKAYNFLNKGYLAISTKKMAYPPVIAKPPRSTIALQWPCGDYHFNGVDNFGKITEIKGTITARGTWARVLNWPQTGVNWLIAKSGPFDISNEPPTKTNEVLKIIQLNPKFS